MLKKRLALVMTLCMAVTAAGCGNPGKNENSKGKDNGESGDKKVVSFYSWSENAEQDFDKAVRKRKPRYRYSGSFCTLCRIFK